MTEDLITQEYKVTVDLVLSLATTQETKLARAMQGMQKGAGLSLPLRKALIQELIDFLEQHLEDDTVVRQVLQAELIETKTYRKEINND